jgi:hypothetical protein
MCKRILSALNGEKRDATITAASVPTEAANPQTANGE